MLKAFVCFFLLSQSFHVIQTNDICFAPFTEFLKCVIAEAETKIHGYEQEALPEVQEKIKTCFRQSNCEVPDFSLATVDYFLPEPWSGRIKTLLDLLENTDPRVQHCMIDYFKGMAERKIQQCVRTYGSPDVKNFEMPPIPETNNLDITKLKMVTLNRMMVYRELLQCARATPSDDNLQITIDCVKAVRTTDGDSLCHSRESCRNTKMNDLVCLGRLDNVLKGACDCVKAEHNNRLDNWRELKESFLQGGMERQYKNCHLQNNLPYPQDKVEAVKKAIQDSVKDILFKGGIPSDVKDALSTAGGALKDIIDEWKKMFCSDCNESKVLSTGNEEAKRLRNAVARQDESAKDPNQNAPSSSNFLDKLRNLFGQQSNIPSSG